MHTIETTGNLKITPMSNFGFKKDKKKKKGNSHEYKILPWQNECNI